MVKENKYMLNTYSTGQCVCVAKQNKANLIHYFQETSRLPSAHLLLILRPRDITLSRVCSQTEHESPTAG